VIFAGSLALLTAAGVGFASYRNANSGMSDLLKANIEALAQIELPEVVVECSADPSGEGKCWDEDDLYPTKCIATGNQDDYCTGGISPNNV
jgi:hypothetical protein